MTTQQISLPEEIQKTKFQGLDGLRGVSIILVLIDHICHNYPFNARFIGKFGVYIFFVISGFLITTLLLKEKLKYGNVSLKLFYTRRALRIVPVLYLYLIVLIVLNAIDKLNITGTSLMNSFLFLKNFPKPFSNDWHTLHLWSLGIEEQFYLIIPLLFNRLSLQQFKRLIQFGIIILPLIAYVYFQKIDINVFHVNRTIHFGLAVIANVLGKGTVFILIGSLFAILFASKENFISKVRHGARYVTSAVLFIAAFALCTPAFPLYVPHITTAIGGILLAIAIILNLKEGSLFGRVLNTGLLQQLGILSYSIYIWQQPFTFQQPWGGNLVINLVALAIVAYLSYYFYEKRFLRYKDHFKRV